MVNWRAKIENMDRRVNAYTNPCVSEVIYRDEWINVKNTEKITNRN